MKKYKQLMAVAAIALAATTVYSADVSATQTPTMIAPADVAVTGFKEPVVTGKLVTSKKASAKNTVTVETVQDLQEHITKELLAFNSNFTVNVNENLTMDELKKLIDDAYQSNGYTRGTVDEIEFSLLNKNGQAVIEVNATYRHTKAQEAMVTKKIEAISTDIIKANMSDIEKLKAIYDYVALQSTYTEDTTNSPYSPYTLLTEKAGVCQAYALLAYRLLEKAGFENYFITGEANGIPHAWNLIKLDGAWYHYDTTWADPVFSESGGVYDDYVTYNYFLVSEQTILKDHSIDSGFPAAADADYVKGLTALNSAVLNYTIGGQTSTLINIPTYHDGAWYYTNAEYGLSMLKNGVTTNLTSGERAFSTVYANEQIFFLNNSLQVSAYHLATKTVEQKTTELATRLRIEDNQLVAYNGAKIVYTEPLPTASDKVISQVTTLIENVFVPNFEQQTTALLANFNALTAEQQALLPVEQQAAIASVQQKLMALQTFNQSLEAKDAWATKKTTDARKPWTVTLSKELENTAANKAAIQVHDMFGEKLEVTAEINGKKLMITPMGDYKPGVPYTLLINKSLKSTDGKTLKKDLYMTFTFEP